jgi:hypothetical protein
MNEVHKKQVEILKFRLFESFLVRRRGKRCNFVIGFEWMKSALLLTVALLSLAGCATARDESDQPQSNAVRFSDWHEPEWPQSSDDIEERKQARKRLR